jgi:hypothetical protein
MLKINMTPALFREEQANRMAQILNEDGAGWRYVVLSNGSSGWCLIGIYDEANDFIGYWTST